jgi:hypothetical protein
LVAFSDLAPNFKQLAGSYSPVAALRVKPESLLKLPHPHSLTFNPYSFILSPFTFDL